MSQPPDEAGRVTPPPFDEFPEVRSRRPVLWLLLVPAVLYCAAPLVANRIEPRVLGVPFLLMWIIVTTVISPIVIWIVSRYDPAYRTDAIEPIPADAGVRTRETGGGAR
ncbi:MAG: hypothetical protein JWR24_581 [Actinoallomurus sp.]|jgi:hypothetical protein|nr:hypothetical protein [Actinoallomurus sp.]